MTLIVAAIHKHEAFMANDTQLTDGNGKAVVSDAPKSFKIQCLDGNVLVAFTGIAEMAGEFTADWLIELCTDLKPSSKHFTEVMSYLKSKINEHYQATYGGFNPPPLVVVASGWTDHSSNCPSIYTLSNCEDSRGAYVTPRHTFELNQINPLVNKTQLIVRGALSATTGKDYKAARKRVMKLLAANSNKLDNRIRAEMAKMIQHASKDIRGTTINDQVMASMLDRRNGSMDYAHFPERADYVLPGFVNENISVGGLKVTGDFVKGGITRVG